MARTKESVLEDMRENPEQHRHDFEELTACCMINEAVDASLIEAHSENVNLGTNGGTRCDVSSGPCACSAWH